MEKLRFIEKTAEYEVIADFAEQESEPMVSVCLSHLRELTAIDTKVGRVGYLHVCKEGEVREPRRTFEITEYHGNFDPISLPR